MARIKRIDFRYIEIRKTLRNVQISITSYLAVWRLYIKKCEVKIWNSFAHFPMFFVISLSSSSAVAGRVALWGRPSVHFLNETRDKNIQ